MRINLLSTTVLIFGLGLISPLTEAKASVVSQSLGRTEQNSIFVLTRKTEQPSPDQIQQNPENLRRKLQQIAQQQNVNVFEQRRQQQRDAQQRQQQQNVNVFEQRRQQHQDAQQRQQQQNVNVFEQRQQQHQDAQQRQQQQNVNVFEQRRQQQDAQQRQQQQNVNVFEQRQQLLQAQQERQIAKRRNWEAQFTRQLAHQRLAWQRDQNRHSWLQQQRLIERERRLDRIEARQRHLYRNYVTYYNRDYWDDSTWQNRNYWDDSTYWSGPGYWYERNYWSQRGYIWDDLLGGILQVLISGLAQGSSNSAFAPYPQANTLYDQGTQILSFNGLTQAPCEPGNVVILLPNQRVMCATPTDSFVPGTYRIDGPDLTLIPAEIQY
jgi:hypothetical protein